MPQGVFRAPDGTCGLAWMRTHPLPPSPRASLLASLQGLRACGRLEGGVGAHARQPHAVAAVHLPLQVGGVLAWAWA